MKVKGVQCCVLMADVLFFGEPSIFRVIMIDPQMTFQEILKLTALNNIYFFSMYTLKAMVILLIRM